MIRNAFLAMLVVIACVALGSAQEKPAPLLQYSGFLLTAPNECSITIAPNGRVTHNCESLDEASEVFWRNISRLGLERSGQIREALEMATEFVRDPDDWGPSSIKLEYHPPDRVGDLEKEIARVRRQKLAAQKIREALALLDKEK